MNTAHIKELQKNDVVRKRLAKYMAQQCFRNTKLEDFHAGKVPEPRTGDNSDVKVVSAREDIPWNELSRLNNEEMKALMIDVVNQCDAFLAVLFATSTGDVIIEELKKRDLVPKWNSPE